MKVGNNYFGLFMRFRRRRMKQFYDLLAPSASTRLLDVGGRSGTWTTESENGWRFPVTLLNVEHVPQPDDARFAVVQGDGTALPFPDNSFDVAFSNSVIEHLGTLSNQTRFAQEICRVAPKLWVQTPARSFPVEPHFLAPFIHWLPRKIQKHLVRNFTVWGWIVRPDSETVEGMLDEIRLLTFAEFQQLFPECLILKERVCGLTKSFVAIRTGKP